MSACSRACTEGGAGGAAVPLAPAPPMPGIGMPVTLDTYCKKSFSDLVNASIAGAAYLVNPNPNAEICLFNSSICRCALTVALVSSSWPLICAACVSVNFLLRFPASSYCADAMATLSLSLGNAVTVSPAALPNSIMLGILRCTAACNAACA